MTAPLSPHTPENWSAVSARYDVKLAEFTGQFAVDLLEAAAFTPEARVLEVAAGTGIVTAPLAKQVHHVTAIDYAPGMLDRLRERLTREAISNVHAAVMDGQALDLADHTFDGALSNFGLMLFADRVKGFSEMCRVLRPGGPAVVSAWSFMERFEPRGVFLKAIQKAFPDFPPPPGVPPIFSLADPEVFAAEMRAGGFAEVRITSVTRFLETASPEAYWDSFQGAAPPANAMVKQLGEAGTARLREQIIADLRARFGDGPVRLSAEARIGVGVK